jgi:hypothetical protein
MKQLYAIILLFVIIFIIYWLTSASAQVINDNPEYFTIFNKIQNPKPISYDDGIISHDDGIISHDDLTIKNLSHNDTKKFNWNKENFALDSFINVQGNKVRRELVSSNYADHIYADANFTLDQCDTITAPQAHNIYF